MKLISTLTSIAAAAFLALGAASAPAQSSSGVDLFPKDTRSHSQREQDRNAADAQKGYEHVERAKAAELMRDKRHDGRLKTSPDSSLGGGVAPPSIDWKATFK